MKHSELVKKHSIVLVGNLTQAWHNLPTAPHGPRKPRPCTTVHAPNVGCSDGKAGHRQRQHGSHEQPVERDANPKLAPASENWERRAPLRVKTDPSAGVLLG